MKKLELKIHPPVVAIIAAMMSWGLSYLFPQYHFDWSWKWWLVSVFLLLAGVFGVSGILQFIKASTTIHPHKPEHTRHLVTTGLYRFTRNPMYLGLLMGLLGFVSGLANPLALLGPVFFVVYITRFQIKPEERILSKKFGVTYKNYLQKVRRWI